ncbi:alpha/beta fold hydrolase, partial [Methylobacterium radiotolerans]|uniref:alpha/beta fold hydrolase n=1 Tax=Methylobacterium radiotolerans TaxID=31998 RepID=UPI001FD9D1DB
GFAVVAFDWRGQGESDRRVDDPHKGHVARFDDYRLDLRAVAETILVPLMPEPHVGLAHSMGGCVALLAALDGALPFRRLVTLAPMLSIRMIRWPAGAAVLPRGLQRGSDERRVGEECAAPGLKRAWAGTHQTTHPAPPPAPPQPG